MGATPKRFAIFILGAGFSRPAGLPTGIELWQEVRRRAVRSGSAAFATDLDRYIEFRRRCDGVQLDSDAVDFEEFLGFLDTEFYLELQGSDTWSDEGNPTQLLVKRLIAKILIERTPAPTRLGDLYLEFARSLQPGDLVLTFNYDVVLERALEAVGKPFRLFAQRWSKIHYSFDDVDSSRAEVIVLKMHGSVDWFHRGQYRQRCEALAAFGLSRAPSDAVFNSERACLQPILDGPRHSDDPLLEMFRLRNADEIITENAFLDSAPWLLNPSSAKVVYAKTLRDFWRGLGRAGGMNLSMAIIGYSLPLHDDYARQAIYRLVRNYQEIYWEEEMLGSRKSPLALVDFRPSEAELRSFKLRYGFVDWTKSYCCMDGFKRETLRVLFPDSR
jgi:hypothetical protein